MTVSAAELLGGDDIGRRALPWRKPSVSRSDAPRLEGERDGALVRFEHVTLGTVAVSPDATEARDAAERARQIAALMAGWTGPGGHPTGIRCRSCQCPGRVGGTCRAWDTGRGRRLVPDESCFLNRETEPSVAEQAQIYGEVLEPFSGHKVVIRTLDAGSDKPLKLVRHPDEANPALGVRLIRIVEGNPGLVERQLEAVASAAAQTGNPPWVMAPMIATAEEAKHFAAHARSYGLTPGVMIEVPVAALLADRILEHVEFLSIGTNDLAQYTMAADRMSAELATLTDPWQPEVLALVAGKPVGVCGEATADPMGRPVC